VPAATMTAVTKTAVKNATARANLGRIAILTQGSKMKFNSR
jgi:hypothetical protein